VNDSLCWGLIKEMKETKTLAPAFERIISFDLITALIKIEIKERQTSGEVKGVIG
jgi:hypothetical protein